MNSLKKLSGSEMIFKEIGPNGSYRILVINEEKEIESNEIKEKKEKIRSFVHKWIDLREKFKEMEVTFLPKALCNVPILSKTFQSRDEVSIPVYVIRPLETQVPTPGIVHIHGGPQTRDQWDHMLNDARYLALLGYTSILPQFRGSQGFGEEHFQGGYRKHMTTVLQDIIDAALWAEKQEYIDKKKTVLMGGSYGGFMTPLILAHKKEEFSFVGGIAFAGFYDVVKSNQKDSKKYNIEIISEDLGWGDSKKKEDREEMYNSSPVNFASKIQVPLLLMHGAHDDNCLYEQAEWMSSALKKAKKPHAFVKLKKEGHAIQPETHPFYLALIEHFLHKVLGRKFEPLSFEEKKSKSKIMSIVRDTTGFFKDFK